MQWLQKILKLKLLPFLLIRLPHFPLIVKTFPFYTLFCSSDNLVIYFQETGKQRFFENQGKEDFDYHQSLVHEEFLLQSKFFVWRWRFVMIKQSRYQCWSRLCQIISISSLFIFQLLCNIFFLKRRTYVCSPYSFIRRTFMDQTKLKNFLNDNWTGSPSW